MMISPIVGLIGNLTLYLLFAGLGIFAWLAWRSRSVKSFQFQISAFLLVWIVGEFVSTLHGIALFKFPYELHDLGMQIHLVSMILFASVVFVRFYYARRAGYKMIERLDSILK